MTEILEGAEIICGQEMMQSHPFVQLETMRNDRKMNRSVMDWSQVCGLFLACVNVLLYRDTESDLNVSGGGLFLR